MELFLIIAGLAFVIWLVAKLESSPSSARQTSTPPTTASENAQREQVVSCSNCGQRNRLREVDATSLFQCGSCHTQLPNPFASLPYPKPETGRTFRPSAAKSSHAKNIPFLDASSDGHVPTLQDLAGVVDAFTGEALNPGLGLYQCTKCQVYYHRASYEVIQSENGGRCVACLSVSINTVAQAQSRSARRPKSAENPRETAQATNYRPEAVGLFNYREHVGRVITFESFVPVVRESRRGGDFAVMLENLQWEKGFKVMVFRRNVRSIGGADYVRSLQGRTIRVRGLLQKHHTFGYQIIVTERSMIQELR